MAVVKIAVSLPADLLARVDDHAASLGKSRSAYLRESLERTMREIEEVRAVREAREIYAAVEQDPEYWRTHLAFSATAEATLPRFDASGAASSDEAPQEAAGR